MDSAGHGIRKCGCFGQLKKEQCGIEARDGAEKENTHAKSYNDSLLPLKSVTKQIGLTNGNVHFTMTMCLKDQSLTVVYLLPASQLPLGPFSLYH